MEAAELLARVGLRENPITKIVDIGVGKQQLVEIAKALSKDVKLLILDEPTAALNDEDSAHLLGLIRGLRDHGITSIIISHKLNEIKAIADSVTIIRDGKTIETLDFHAGEVSEERIIRGMVGRDLESRYPERDRDRRGGAADRGLDGAPSAGARPDGGRQRQSLRPRGGGGRHCRTDGRGSHRVGHERFRPLVRHNISGNLYKHGTEIKPAPSPGDRARHRVRHRGPQALRPEPDRGHPAEHLRLGTGQAGQAAAGSTPTRKRVVANDYRKSMRIKAPNVAVITGKLSGGNQQKVVLSKWMFSDPDVLILDEPTRGIDVGAKYEIYTIINELAAQGKAVIVISSELPELLGICDRIYALSAGRITGEVADRRGHPEKLMHYMTKEKE